MQTYEAMFLVNSSLVPDWAGAEVELQRILDRAEAKVLALRRWDERKLAYEIEGQKRGLYGLAYFEANGEKIPEIERDVQISEKVLRVLVTRADGMTPEKIEAIFAKAPTMRATERSEGDYGDDGDDRRRGRGDYRGGGGRRDEGSREEVGAPMERM